MSFNPSLRPLCDIESLSDNATAFSNRSKQLEGKCGGVDAK